MANAKPLRSADQQPQDVQFKHFGVMNSGSQSKASTFTAITVNVILVLILVIIGAATKKVVDQRKAENLAYITPLKEKPPPPPKPIKPPPPPKIPPVPPKEILKPIVLRPEVKLPDPPKPVVVKEIPKPPTPVVMPAPPKIQVAAAAPKVVAVNMAKAATITNHDTHPTTVDMGHPDSPVPSKTGPAVSNIRLGAGAAGMPPNPGGRGPVGVTSLGSGQPTGTIGGRSAVAVAGVPHGVIGGDPNSRGGNGLGRTPPQQVQMGQQQNPPAAVSVARQTTTKTAPTVTYKPAAVYTEEARAQHIEGTVRVHIRVTASGQVQVVGIVSGLGHGLDQSAMQVCQGMKFKPAIDSNGNATDWEGNVTVSFQLA